MYTVTLSEEDVFKVSTNINVMDACATLASKQVLDRLIQFAESQEVEKYNFNVIIQR